MNNVILEVKKLVSEEKFNELKNELSSYEDFEAVYEEILKEIEEENLKNIDHDSEKNEDEEKKSILYFLYSEFYY